MTLDEQIKPDACPTSTCVDSKENAKAEPNKVGKFAKELKDDAVQAVRSEIKYTVRSTVRQCIRSVIKNIFK